MLIYLVEDLAHHNKVQEAKGLILRHDHIEKFLKSDLIERLGKVAYAAEQDTALLQEDSYGPLSHPKYDNNRDEYEPF